MIDSDLDALSKRAENFVRLIDVGLDPQLTTLLHRYICTLLSANLDKAVHLILAEFARRHGSEELRRFVSGRYARGTNYTAEKLTQTLGSFRTEWGEKFKEEAVKTGLKEQVDTLYGLRNSISHGEQVSVSRPTLEGYLKAHKRAIELIKSIVLT